MRTLRQNANRDNHKNKSQGHPKPKKHDLGVKRSNFCEKLCFAIHRTPNPCFSKPRRPDSNPTITRKRNVETSMNEILVRFKITEKLSKWELEIQKSTRMTTWLPKCPFLCSQVPQDRLRVSPQACQMTSSSTKNNYPPPKIPRIHIAF